MLVAAVLVVSSFVAVHFAVRVVGVLAGAVAGMVLGTAGPLRAGAQEVERVVVTNDVKQSRNG